MPRGRVRVEHNTIVSDQGTLLRGVPVWIYQWGRRSRSNLYARDPSFYEKLREAGVNAVRLICFDPWQRSHNYPAYDLNKVGDRREFLQQLDQAVELAGKSGLYVLINYHDVGRYDHDHLLHFWTLVAHRYAAATHVVYELANEPVSWFPEDYDDQTLRDQEELYHLVRDLAPQTHTVLLTFANTCNQDSTVGMADVADRLRDIDWTHASVGFHPYYTDGTSRSIKELRRRFPVVNTEMGLPSSFCHAEWPAVPMDGEEWGFQTMERLGISWFAWDVEGPDKFGQNFVGGLLEDAKAKQYVWPHDQDTATRGPSSRMRQFLREFPLRRCREIMGVQARHLFAAVLLPFAVALFDGAMLALLIPIARGVAVGSFETVAKFPVVGLLAKALPAVFADYRLGFLILAAAVVACGALKNAAGYAHHVFIERLYGIASRNLSNFAFQRYLHFGKGYFDSKSQGQVAAVVDYNHDVLSILRAFHQVLSTGLILAAYLAVMLLISWKLTLVCLAMAPLWRWASERLLRRVSAVAGEINRTNLKLNRRSFEILSGLPLYRAFAKEAEAFLAYSELNERRRKVEFRASKLRGRVTWWREMAVLLMLLGLLPLVVFVLAAGRPSEMPVFVVFFFVAKIALPQLVTLNELALVVAERAPKAQEFARLFDDSRKWILPDGDRPFRSLREGVKVRGLSFAYPGRTPVLRDIELGIEAGRMTALVGRSGAGKSTLTHLLMRFYDVQPGTIFFDGVDIREFQIASLRQRMALVSQDVYLFNDTLRRNITLAADGDVDDEKVLEVLVRARLSDLLERLPRGLDSPVGDRGANLSGGERQRVALARALFKEADFLILDEATSSLDSRTEALIQTAINEAVRDRTTLVIAHRLSTIRRADRIAVLDDGRVAEQGSLEELTEREGLFAELWSAQTFS